ncbi:lytic transglycosylase domain-containing protein [Sphingomonas sp. ABOLG]|uniref:lytic transglycosylase domain-containing protein n=1 Tax=Sphingomonas sp. ABOLG TaxID=1985880 RepID=UPI000F7E17D6|nr:lytic transglycosylase domain-containing protein [Sphingomonas sp. ABOLG]RSV20358.1 lytic transglycosylase domain-containing protein [Sphingomonas sp. ABOLG]
MPSRAPQSFRDPRYDEIDSSVEAKLGLPKGLLSSVRLKGERSNADQVSSAGAQSVYQIIPATRSALMKKYGVDAYEGPEQAALAAGYVLREGLDRNKGSAVAAVAEYHGGTDRRQHGPVNRAYVARVTGTAGDSTFDRVRAKRTVEREAESGPSLAKVYAAYRRGLMSPEQAAQFEHDVNMGAVLLPPGGKLKKTPAAPQLPAGVVRAYNDMSSGMTVDQRREIDNDLRDGIASLPRGAKLNPWREGTTAEKVGRGLGLGARSIIEGVGSAAGMVMNPLNSLLNVTGLPQRITGQPLAMANDPDVNVADMMGLPKPRTEAERMLSAIEQGASGGLATAGAGWAASGARGAAGMIGRALASSPTADVISGGLGGGSSDAARQSGFGPTGQLVAGLIGGGAGVAGVVGAERVAATRLGRRAATELPSSMPREAVIDRSGELTEDGQELVARHGFEPDEIKHAYDDASASSGDASPGGRNNETPPASDGLPREASELAAASTPMVRRHEGSDYPVQIVGPEQADASGRVHVQVRGLESGEVGFVPKDEIFPAAQAAQRAAASAVEPVPAARPPAFPAGDAAGSPRAAAGRTAADRTREAEALGIPLTRGQATQDFAVQDTEQTLRAQASGEGEKARTFLVDQAEKIREATVKFREAFGATDMTKADRGRVVVDALRELRDRGKAGINALYREAQEMGGDGLSLDTSGITDAARRALVEADVPDSVKNVIRQEMARYGLIGKNPVTAEDGITTVTLADGRKIQFYGDPEPLTVGNAEAFRKAINSQYTADGPRKLSQPIKGAVDDAVEAAVELAARNGVSGPVGDTLRRARQAVVTHKETFAAKDVVQNLIDWKKGTRTDNILPEHAIREVLSGEVSNLRRIKAVLLSSPTATSKAAWRAVQAEGIGGIFDKAYTANSNLGSGPAGSVSGAKLNSEIIRFGVPKLKVLLDEGDFNRLMSLRRVIGEATIPIAGTTNPSGSAFKLMRFLAPMAARFSSIPFAGPLIDVASGVVKQAKATAEAKQTLAGMTSYSAKKAAAEPATKAAASASRVTKGDDPEADKRAADFIEALIEAGRSGRLTAAIIGASSNATAQRD